MRKNPNPFPSSLLSSKHFIDPVYEIFWNLPDLEAPFPVVSNPRSEYVGLIVLFSDAYRRVKNLEAWVRGAIYSRLSALKYTDAVSARIDVKLYIEDILRPHLESVLRKNFIDVDRDVIWFSAPSLPRSKDGVWGYLGKQMCPYWDEQLMDYDRIIVWDADTFFLPRSNFMFTHLQSLADSATGYIFVIPLEWSEFRYDFRHKLSKATKLSGMPIDDLLMFSDVSLDTFPSQVSKPFGSMWSYAPRHYHRHHSDFIDWMRSYAPYFGNDELCAVCWSHKFGIELVSLDLLLDLKMYDTPSFLNSPELHTKINVLHGLPSASQEAEFHKMLEII